MKTFVPAALLLLLLLAATVRADGRRLPVTDDTGVVLPGDQEAQLSLSPRFGRDAPYSRLDARAGLEVGLSRRVQQGVFLHAMTQADGEGEQLTGAISNEWKWRPVGDEEDPRGLTLIAEGTLGFTGSSAELKAVVDHQLGALYLALTAGATYQWTWGSNGRGRFVHLEQTAGLSYRVTSSFHLGGEARNHLLYDQDRRFLGDALFVGPTLSFEAKAFWFAASFTPQVFARLPRGEDPPGPTDPIELTQHERFMARLLIGFPL